MTDLIEDLKRAKDSCGTIGRDALDRAIAALEAPLPHDVEQKTKWLRQEAIRICDISPNINSPNETQEWQLADMLERLARDRDAMDEERVNNYKIAQECEQENFELQQRIEELEDLTADYKNVMDGVSEENKRLDAALDEIEEMDQPTVLKIMDVVRKARAGK